MTTKDLALVGPTATGKSALAVAIARELGDVEIVSVDSMQVYRGMDIGTAKLPVSERGGITHHLLDVVDPHREFGLAEFQQKARQARADISDRGKRALLVGGTGLYVRALVDDFDIPGQFPEARRELDAVADTALLWATLKQLDSAAAAKIEPDNRRRLVRALEVCQGSGRPFSSFGPGVDAYAATPNARLIGVWTPRLVGAARIEARVKEMLDAGWLDEVACLRSDPGLSKTALAALGYRQLAAHLDGELELNDACEQIVVATKAFARRQRVWFRRDPRISWFGTNRDPSTLLPALLEECTSPVQESEVNDR